MRREEKRNLSWGIRSTQLSTTIWSLQPVSVSAWDLKEPKSGADQAEARPGYQKIFHT